MAGVLVTTLGARSTVAIGAAGMALANVWIVASPLRRLRTVTDAASPDRTPSRTA